MAYEVLISTRAEQNLEEIAAYLEANWSATVKTDFLSTLAEKIAYISEMPYMYRSSLLKFSIRECTINQHCKMYYRVIQQTVEIITIQSSYINPEGIVF